MSWLHRVLGKDGATQMGVDSKHFAARVSGRPMELGTRGAYALGVGSGTIAAGIAANAEIFQMRWVDATRICLVRSIILNAARDTTAFTAGPFQFEARMRRAYTADGASGTAIVFSTANTNKKRTDFPLSLFSDTGCRVSNTGALTAGTGTLDTNAFAHMTGFVSSAATTAADNPMVQPGAYLWQRNTHEEYPLLLEQNEGFVIRVVTMPATGTWRFSVNVEWAEIDPAAVDGWG